MEGVRWGEGWNAASGLKLNPSESLGRVLRRCQAVEISRTKLRREVGDGEINVESANTV